MSTLLSTITGAPSSPAIIVPSPSSSAAALTSTYSTLHSHVSAYQAKLASIGITHGSYVSIATPNSYEFIVSFLAAFYLFALRPCCCGRRKASASGGLTGDGLLPGGLTVLPVGGQQQRGKKGKKGKKGQQQAQDVQVNLIVDPPAFGSSSRRCSACAAAASTRS